MDAFLPVIEEVEFRLLHITQTSSVNFESFFNQPDKK